MSRCQGCEGGNAPHDRESEDHIKNMSRYYLPESESEKFFRHLNNGEVRLVPDKSNGRGELQITITEKGLPA